MLKNDELKVLQLIKLVPIFVMFLFSIVLYTMLQNNNTIFEEETKEIEKLILEEQKEKIQREVERVHAFIVNKRASTVVKIKENIKENVDIAHAIALSIYENNQSKSKAEVTKLIKDALREIRFNNKRGYFFIHNMKGTNVLHPILPKLENTNLQKFQDAKGMYVSKEMIKIAKSKKEGFLTWWWVKPNNKKDEFKKIGFVKYFEPYDWFIGTGEYIVDYEAELKEDLLQQITQVRYDENGYVFVIDYAGTYKAHKNKIYIGQNRIDYQDSNDFFLLKEIIKTAKKGGEFLKYISTVNPNTGLPAEKISFIRGLDDWGWAIGSGVYVSDIEDKIGGERLLLNQKNTEHITNIIIVNVVAFLVLLLLSFYFSKEIEKRFKRYGEKVKSKNNELLDLNTNLEIIVTKRTEKLNKTNLELEETIQSLKETKKDLISSQKMATLGELVSSISHELNTPVGLSITAVSQLDHLREQLLKEFENENMTEEYFMNFTKDTEELTKILTINLNNTKNLIHSFKSVAVDQAIEEKREIDLKDYINEIFLTLRSKIKKMSVKISLECTENIILNTYPGFISQILINLINNSMLHGFKNTPEKIITISIEEIDNNISICYIDNGEGIKDEIIDKVFDQYYTTKKNAGGTGLGLYIIKRIIIDKLKGNIEIKKEQEIGTCFLINIPKNL